MPPRSAPRVFVRQSSMGVFIESDANGDSTVLLGHQLDRVTAVSVIGMEDDDHALLIHTTSKDIEIPFYSRTNLRQAQEQLIKALQK